LFDRRAPRRRAVYGYIDRQDLPNLFRVFDFASPDQHVARRTRTTVPQQALYLMNSPFLRKCAEAVVDRTSDASDAQQRLKELTRIVLGRDPDPAESQLLIAMVDDESQRSDEETAWRLVATTLLQTNEFLFVD
jgi:hypothetical protein